MLKRFLLLLALLAFATPAHAALQFSDIACETSDTTGTGTLNLNGAVSGYLSFAGAGITSGNTVPYQIRSGGNLETGIGTFTDAATDTLARTTVKYSSSGAATALNLSATSTICIGPISSLFTGGGSATSWNPTSSDGASLGTSSLLWSDLYLAAGGIIYANTTAALTVGTTTAASGVFGHSFDFGSTNGPELQLTNSSAGAGGPLLTGYHNSASPAASDVIFSLNAFGKDSAANTQYYAGIDWAITDPTSTSEDSSATHYVMSGGSILAALTLGGTDPVGDGFGTSHVFRFSGSNDEQVVILSPNASTSGPALTIFDDSASPAANDVVGRIYFYGRDSVAGPQNYAYIQSSIVDPTSGSEDGKLALNVISAGSDLTALTLGTTSGDGNLSHRFSFGSATFGTVEAYSTEAAGSPPQFSIFSDSASPAANDDVGYLNFQGRDSAANSQKYADISAMIVDPTSGSEDSSLKIRLQSGGSLLTALTLGTTNPTDASLAAHVFNFGSVNYPSLVLQNSGVGNNAAELTGYLDRSVPASTTVDLFYSNAIAKNASGTITSYGYAGWSATDGTAGSEDATYSINVTTAGAGLNALTLGDAANGLVGYAHIFNLGSADAPELLVKNSSAATGGPGLVLYQNSASPAASDFLATIYAYGKDSAANDTQYANISFRISDPTNGSEDSRTEFNVLSAGSTLTALTLGSSDVWGDYSHVFDLGANDAGTVMLKNSAATSGGPGVISYHNSASPAADDYIGWMEAWGNDSAANAQRYGNSTWLIVDPTSGSEDSKYAVSVYSGGSSLEALTLGGTDVWSRFGHIFDAGSTNFGGIQVQNTSAGTGGPAVNFYANSASPAVGDWVGLIDFVGKDSGAANQEYGYFGLRIADATAASEDSTAEFHVYSAGSDLTALTLGTTAVDGVDAHVFNVGNGNGPALQVQSNGSGTFGPQIYLYQNSASPANNDVSGGILSYGKDSGGNLTEWGEIRIGPLDVTNGSEDGYIDFYTTVAGVTAYRVEIAAGIMVGAPTGGDKGAGTANFDNDIYKDNTAYTNPDYALEHWATGKIEKFKHNDGASDYRGITPLDDLEGYMRAHLDLPGVKSRADDSGGVGIFARGDIALEKIEESFIYITQLNNRLKDVEARKAPRCYGLKLPFGCLGLTMEN